MKKTIKFQSYNLHKGRDIFASQYSMLQLKEALKIEKVDIGCFQEVLGENLYEPDVEHQIELIADEVWKEYSFAKNSVVSKHEHGNAILSKYPIKDEKIIDLTLNIFEKRSAIITKIDYKGFSIYCINTHLNLREKDRIKQAQILLKSIKNFIPDNAPVIIGGDFNDWTGKIACLFKDNGFRISKELKTFPSFFPFLSLDRIMIKNCSFINEKRGDVKEHKNFSDHLPLLCEIEL